MKKAKPWYRLRATRKTAELLIYSEIGAWGKSVAELLAELDALGDKDTINLRINSPGGDVFEAMAMYNGLARQSAEVIVHIDGLCASAATLVALAGDEVRMADNAMWMIHDPWTALVGNAEDFEKKAGLLDTLADAIVDIYARKTGADPDDIRDWMRAETWYTAEQALAAGFVDVVTEPLKMAALVRHDLTRFKNCPQENPMAEEQPTEPVTPAADDTPAVEAAPEPEAAAPAVEAPAVEAAPVESRLDAVSIARLCNKAGEPLLTPLLLAEPFTEAQVKARLEQAGKVRQICALARVPDMAADLIASGADEKAAMLATWNALVARSEANPVDGTPAAPISEALPLDERCQMQWDRDPALRAEFLSFTAYRAFKRAEAAGLIKTFGGKTV
ncbi:MAG: Clp protease ClpP [Chromatiaceae bacterium]|nr:Clp protease ClpP [Candidatus Thioaporhodococcus sediminis]